MPIPTRDPAVLCRITPERLGEYLRQHGWQGEPWCGRTDVLCWTHTVHPDACVLQPLHRKYSDYAERMAQALIALETVLQRERYLILKDLVPDSQLP